MLQCFARSPIPKVGEKKWATGQSFIRKESTTYRIGTLVKVSKYQKQNTKFSHPPKNQRNFVHFFALASKSG